MERIEEEEPASVGGGGWPGGRGGGGSGAGGRGWVSRDPRLRTPGAGTGVSAWGGGPPGFPPGMGIPYGAGPASLLSSSLHGEQPPPQVTPETEGWPRLYSPDFALLHGVACGVGPSPGLGRGGGEAAVEGTKSASGSAETGSGGAATEAEAPRRQAQQEALDGAIEAVFRDEMESGERELKRLHDMSSARDVQDTAIAEARAKLRRMVGRGGGGLAAVAESQEGARQELEAFLASCSVAADVPEKLRLAAHSSLQAQTGRVPDSEAVADLALKTLEELISVDAAWGPEQTSVSRKTVQKGQRQGQRFLQVELAKGHFADTAMSQKGAYVTWPQPGRHPDDCQLWVPVHLPPSANGAARMVAQTSVVPWRFLAGVLPLHPAFKEHIFDAGGGMTAPTDFTGRNQKGVAFLVKVPEGEEAAAGFLQRCPRVLTVRYQRRDHQVYLSTRLWTCTSCLEQNGEPARGHLSTHEGECSRFSRMMGDRLARSMGGMRTDATGGQQKDDAMAE